MPPITPLILGSGMSGQAIAKSMAILSTQHPNLSIAPAKFLSRSDSLSSAFKSSSTPILFIANPHGLHAKTLLEASKAGFTHIVCEKPACTSLEEVNSLRNISSHVAILHGYRVMWGPHELKRLVASGELGEIFAIEGRYWQSSAAARAVQPAPAKSGWKNDTTISGPHDVLLDLSTHWLDLATSIIGALPTHIHPHLFFANSEASHRDTHNHLSITFPKNIRGAASISKTVHGATNDLEIMILGTKGSATWKFLNPDELIIGKGSSRTIVARQDRTRGSTLPSFHAAGWLEGYIEICSQMLNNLTSGKPGHYPTLRESLDLLEVLFRATQQSDRGEKLF